MRISLRYSILGPELARSVATVNHMHMLFNYNHWLLLPDRSLHVGEARLPAFRAHGRNSVSHTTHERGDTHCVDLGMHFIVALRSKLPCIPRWSWRTFVDLFMCTINRSCNVTFLASMCSDLPVDDN